MVIESNEFTVKVSPVPVATPGKITTVLPSVTAAKGSFDFNIFNGIGVVPDNVITLAVPDQTSAYAGILEALKQLNTKGGGQLNLGAGIYLTAQMDIGGILNNVVICGAGGVNNSTIIRMTGTPNVNSAVFSSGSSSVTNVVFKDLTIDGNAIGSPVVFHGVTRQVLFDNCCIQNQPPGFSYMGAGANGFLIFFYGGGWTNEYLWVNNCFFSRSTGGNDMIGGTGINTAFTNNTIDDNGNGGEGIGWGGPNSYNTNIIAQGNVTKNLKTGSGFVGNGIHFEGGGSGLYILNNTLSGGSGGNCIHVHPYTSGSTWSNVLIDGNVIDGQPGYNSNGSLYGLVSVLQVNGITISNNKFSYDDPAAIMVEDGENITITGNTMAYTHSRNRGFNGPAGKYYGGGSIIIAKNTSTNITSHSGVSISGNTLTNSLGTTQNVVIDTSYTNVSVQSDFAVTHITE